MAMKRRIGTSRRDILKAGAAVPALGAFGGLAACARAAGQAAGASPIPGHVASAVPSPDTLGGWLKQLHDVGPIRATGTPQARAFEEFLAAEFTKLGCTIERDQFRLTAWECDIKDCSISVTEDGGATRNLEIVSYYPFGGSTRGKDAVSGRVIFGGVGEKCGEDILKAHSAEELAKSIVVVDMPLAGGGVRGSVKYYPGSFPDPLPPVVNAPHVAKQGGRGPMQALEGKCKGIILCYTDVSNEAARYNYLPFSDKHRTMPGLWVGKADSDYLKSVSGKATATMRCDAKLTPDARADTIVATMKGATDEVIFMTTQTDGPNECNENGALGLLAAATYLAKIPDRKRTVVFCLPTGHYAAGAIADPDTGSGRRAGTAGVISGHPDVMARTVAQIHLEQMAAMEWADLDGHWQATGIPAEENWIPTPVVHDLVNRMFLATTAGLAPKYSRSGLVESGQAPGEGGQLRSMGIPGIGLMGSPHYFFRADPNGVLDKLSPQVMHNQVEIATRLLAMMDRLTPEQMKGAAPISAAELGQA
ncbi:MAG: hypothetical protein GC155_15630 [Alphaproteobacteria bacterium]|nr:hypothetical protein [Alphaproteobacteria bacterium]